MIKNALLPIKFYHANEIQDYYKIKNYGGDIAYLKDHWVFFPAFQLTMPDIGKHWGILDFDSINCINLGTGDTFNLLDGTTYLYKYPEVYNKAGDFRSLVNYRYPRSMTYSGVAIPEGRYYYHIIAGETEWFSEIFELCDFDISVVNSAFDNEANFAFFISSYSATSERSLTEFCHAAAAGIGSAYTDEFEVILEEEIDFYVRTENTAYGGVCAAISTWDGTTEVNFELRDASGQVVSDVFTVSEGEHAYTFTLKSFVGGTVRLYMWIASADALQGQVIVWTFRRYIEDHIQLRYSNTNNLCKIWYENQYENVFFLNAKQVIDQQVINEEVTEDDQANKYRIIGTNQKWNNFQFVSGEAMLNAMSLLRIHNTRKIIKETGEIMDVSELLMEYSILDYEASLIKLIYREESCSEEACGFDSCCPTPGVPIMEEVQLASGSLIACGAGTDGRYALVRSAAQQFQMYFCNGAAWAVTTTYDIEGYCIEARQNEAALYENIRFFWYDTSVSRWRPHIYLSAVNDNADGTADMITHASYMDGITIIGEYYDTTTEKWTECTTQVDLTAGGGAITLTTLDEIPGTGTFDFRFHAFTSDCDYGYSNTVTQTIT